MENGSTFLETPNYRLRTLTVADVDGNYRHWLNDQEVVRHNSHGRFPQTAETLKHYVQSVAQQTGQIVLAIIDKKTEQHIGNISLQQISWVDRSAEIAFLLGEKSFWGKGVMLEAGAKLIEHAFGTLNLHRVHCGTSSENEAMQKLALKLGMTQEGIRKEAIFNGGNYHDLIEFGILNHY
jgi:RimJ/RimL family protein N-acetyltransferase